MKRVLREAFWAGGRAAAAGSDYVVVARPDAREPRRARGHAAACARALAELVDGLGGAPADARDALRPSRSRRSALYQRVISPALPRRCKYHPTCSAYAVQAIESLRHTARLGARGLAAAALQPVQPRRLRPRLGADAVPPRRAASVTLLSPCSSFATNPLQPLIDFFEAILMFFHDTSGSAGACRSSR